MCAPRGRLFAYRRLRAPAQTGIFVPWGRLFGCLQALDTHNTGRISLSELQQGMKEAGTRADKAEVEALFHTLDQVCADGGVPRPSFEPYLNHI